MELLSKECLRINKFCTLKKLRVLLYVNNLYSVYSPISVRQPQNRKISEMVSGLGMNTLECDGNDIVSCEEHLKRVIANIRKTSSPFFIEFKLRWREHCGPNYDNDIGYRKKEEFEHWKKNDPIENFKKYLLKKIFIDSNHLEEIKKNIDKEVSRVFIDADKANFPDIREAYKGVFATIDNLNNLEVID